MKRKSSIWQFLQASGVLATGDDTLIKQKKAEYRRLYKAEWQRSKRNSQTSINYFLTKSEVKIVKKHTKDVQNLSAFMKSAALAQCNASYCVPDELTVRKIEAKIGLLYSNMTQLMEAQVIKKGDCQRIINELTDLEQRYFSILRTPKTLLELLSTELQANPALKEEVKKVLTNSNGN